MVCHAHITSTARLSIHHSDSRQQQRVSNLRLRSPQPPQLRVKPRLRTASRETPHFRLMKTKIESVIKATAALSARKLNVCAVGLERLRTSVNMRVCGALPNTFDVKDARRLRYITGSRRRACVRTNQHMSEGLRCTLFSDILSQLLNQQTA